MGFRFASSGSRKRSTSGGLSRSMPRSACGGFGRFGSPFSPQIPSNQARPDRSVLVSFVQKGVRESYQMTSRTRRTASFHTGRKACSRRDGRDANITRTNVFIQFEHLAAKFDKGGGVVNEILAIDIEGAE